MSIGELQGRARYQISAVIRADARWVMSRSKRVRACENCGYDNHVEVCHLPAVSSWPSETMLSVVNDLDHLYYLCPNCHWELDAGLLSVDQLKTNEKSSPTN